MVVFVKNALKMRRLSKETVNFSSRVPRLFGGLRAGS